MQISREPIVLIQGLIIPLLMTIIMLFRWPPETVGVVNAALLAAGGVVAAFGVSVDAVLPLLTGFAKAVLAVALAFGAHVPTEWQATVLGVISVAVAFYSRTQVTAKVKAAYALAA